MAEKPAKWRKIECQDNESKSSDIRLHMNDQCLISNILQTHYY